MDPQIAKAYIGGRGLGIYFMSKEVEPTCDPFSGANKLILATGPLTGTRAPTGARYMVMTQSPLTGALTCSNSGGHFPTELKRAGERTVNAERLFLVKAGVSVENEEAMEIFHGGCCEVDRRRPA